jgi:hypothetical protein
MMPENTPSTPSTGLALRANLESQIIQRDAAGMTTLVISPELRKRYNVLAPTAVMGATSTRFTPSISVLSIPETDWYPIEKTKVRGEWVVKSYAALRGALLQIADAAGAEFVPGQSRGEYRPPVTIKLPDGTKIEASPYMYTSTVRVRRHDGTWKSYVGTAVFKPDVAMLEIEDNVSRYDDSPQPGTDAYARAVRKQFLQVYKFAERMAESKAQNAAMRSAGLVDQKYAPAEIAKPFLILSYGYAGGNDAGAQAIDAALVTGNAVTAADALYGSAPARPVDGAEWDAIEEPSAEILEGEVVEDEAVGIEEIITGEAEEDIPFNDAPASDFAGDEPLSDGGQLARNAALANALQSVYPSGRNKGKTLEQVLEDEPKYVNWTADKWQEASFRAAAELVASAHAMGLL